MESKGWLRRQLSAFVDGFMSRFGYVPAEFAALVYEAGYSDGHADGKNVCSRNTVEHD